MKDHIQIAIDGPGGAGKSTVSKAIAARLGIVYVDTGALYRTVGYFVRSKNVTPSDRDAVTALLPLLNIEVKYENGAQHVYLNGEDPGDRIRTPEMSMYASAVSAVNDVRAFLLGIQQKMVAEGGVVMDGRDIGTVIMPGADVKLFMEASPEARARRRFEELQAKGDTSTEAEVLADIIKRDANDRGRAIAPAIPAPDAIFVDNSEMTPAETLAHTLEIIRNKVGITL